MARQHSACVKNKNGLLFLILKKTLTLIQYRRLNVRLLGGFLYKQANNVMLYQGKKISVFFLFFLGLCFSYAQKKLEVFPYQAAGLSEEEAAIHLLSRFTYGYNVNDVRQIQKEGLERWFFRQLGGKTTDKELAEMLEPYADAMMDNKTLAEKYPRNTRVRRMMINEGYIPKDSVINRSAFFKEAYKNYLAEKGFKPEQELYRKFIAAKVLRAAFSANQLQEVMTDFWFNHFNVSFTKPQSAPFIPSYENHVIRPRALGKFDEPLLATAKSPAMLLYLDNASSVAERPNAKNKIGINENYARELLELHTLGVDGGYTQKDVSEAARILTGWTIYPLNGYGNQNLIKQITKGNEVQRQSLIEEDFVFAANRHDKRQKTVLGKDFENNGYEEGVELIFYLSSRPQTARFVSKKIAVRFVSDTPQAALIENMANAFLASEGDIKKILTAMVYSPAFWHRDNVYSKVKTPFELAISSVRALDAQVEKPNRLINWVTRMGEKKYYYIAPTGFPDKSSYWINTGSLLNRMNFGLSFTSNKASGINIDLLELTRHHEPESPEHALDVYAKLLLPTTDIITLKNRLSPLLTTQNLQKKVAKSFGGDRHGQDEDMLAVNTRKINNRNSKSNNAMLAQVVGLIIGSPEFQRR